MYGTKKFIISSFLVFIMSSMTALAATPVSQFKFDEKIYNEVQFEAVDNVAGLNGIVSEAIPVSGKICRAVDLSAKDKNDYVRLPFEALDQKKEFTLATWIKTDKAEGQAILSASNPSSDNEMLWWLESGTEIRTFLYGTAKKFTLSDVDLSDNKWHHLAWTRGAGESCIYVDKVLQACEAQNTDVVDISHAILGQESDAAGVRTLSKNKTATQSSDRSTADGRANLAVDGNTDGNYFIVDTDGNYSNGSISHTAIDSEVAGAENQPWWQVDLGIQTDISQVRIHSRTDCCANRLKNFYVFVSEKDMTGKSLDDLKTLADTTASALTTPTLSGAIPIIFKVYKKKITSLNGKARISVNFTETYGRYVRIQLEGTDEPLSLAEVEVLGEENLAELRPSKQSVTLTHVGIARTADFAVNGVTVGRLNNTNPSPESASSTGVVATNPYWQVDLGNGTPSRSRISKINLWNRLDCGSPCRNRLSEFYIFIADYDMGTSSINTLRNDTSVFAHYVTSLNDLQLLSIPLNNVKGRYVRIQKAATNLSLGEVQVFGTMIVDGFDGGQGFEGLIDELLIYDHKLTESEVGDIYDKQNAGLKLDGSANDCPNIFVAQYHLEDDRWNGTADEVNDFSGNNHHGVSQSSTNNHADILGSTYGISGDPGTCKNGAFNSDHQQHLSIPNHNDFNPSESFAISAWVFPNSAGSGIYRSIANSRYIGSSSNKTGYALFVGIDNKFQFWISSGSSDYIIKTPNALTENQWHHVTATFDVASESAGVYTGTQKLYINGVLVARIFNQKYTPNTKTTSPLIIGAAALGVGVIAANSHFMDGRIDEVQVLTGVVNDLKAADLYSQSHDCVLPDPVAGYHFENGNWTGATGQLKDYVGSNHATGKNGNSNATAQPALSGNPGTCESAIFNSADTRHASIAYNNKTNRNGSFSVAFWAKSQGGIGQFRSAVASRWDCCGSVDRRGFNIYAGDNNKWQFWTGGTYNVWEVLNGGNVIHDTWSHIAVTFEAKSSVLNNDGSGYIYTGTKTLYVNGVGTSVDNAHYAPNKTNSTVIGAVNGSGGGDPISDLHDFSGRIDEVQFYKDVLSARQILEIMGQRHECQVQDHFHISHNRTGVNCEAETVTISMHNAEHEVYSDYTGTVSLTTSTNNGGWGKVTANGTLTDSDLDDGAASYVFNASDNGVAVLKLKNPHAETVSINVSDTVYTETTGEAVSGNGSSSDDPDLTFSGTMFKIVENNASFSPVGTQISNKPFHIAPNAQNIVLRAVKTNTNTLQCEPLFTGEKAIELAFECRSPNTCSADSAYNVTVEDANNNNVSIAPNNNLSVTNYTSVTLDFGTNQTWAPLKYNYPDAGMIRLYARYNQLLIDNTTPSGEYISGHTGEVVVKPAGLCVEAIETTSACTSGDHTCSVFKKAGEAFNLMVKAVGWEKENDTDFCATAAVTPTGNQTTPNFKYTDIDLSSALVAPSGGVNTTLAVKKVTIPSISTDKGSTTIINQQSSEVGVFTISTPSLDYKGVVDAIPASTSANIGRFIPDHFVITTGADPITDGCAANNFSYMGQTFSMLYSLTAKNRSNVTTKNYRGDFVRLSNSTNSLIGTSSVDYGANDTLDYSTRLDEKSAQYTWGTSSGIGTVNSQFIFNRQGNGQANVDGNFLLDIGVTVEDADGVTLSNPELNVDIDNDNTNDHGLIGTSVQRYGRLVFDDAIGPVNENLTMPIRTEFFNGTDFVTNTDDTCSGGLFTVANFNITDPDSSDNLTPALVNTTANPMIYNTITAGEGSLVLTAPDQRGLLNVLIDLPNATAPFVVPDWLRYDFNGDGAETSPMGLAVFGQFQGNNRIIYSRELVND